MGSVHRRGVGQDAKKANKAHKRPCRSAPAAPTGVTLGFGKREVHGHKVWRGHTSWVPVEEDVAGRSLNIHRAEVQLRATDASGEPVETNLQADSATADGSDFTVQAGSAPTRGRARELDSGTDVIKKTLTGLTVGIDAQVDFSARKDAGGSAPVLKCEIYNTTDNVSVASKNGTPDSTSHSHVIATRSFTPALGKTYEARVTFQSGSGVGYFDQIQWHDKGTVAIWKKIVAGDATDCVFLGLARADSWYYQTRVRVQTLDHGVQCWGAFSAWTDATQPVTGALTGPPAPDGLSFTYDRVGGHAKNPFRGLATWNETAWWTPPDGDPVQGAGGYDVRMAVSDDGGTHTLHIRRHHILTHDADTDLTASAEFTHLTRARAYRTSVRAFDSEGTVGAWSGWTPWSTPSSSSSVGAAPGDPRNVETTTPVARVLRTTWDEPLDFTDVDLYKVEVFRGAALRETVYTRARHHRYNVPEADAGTSHRVHVTSYDEGGNISEVIDPGADTAETGTLTGTIITTGTLPGAALDGSAIITVKASDGAAPGSSPAPTVLGGVGMLFVRWTAVANADPLTYEVHVSTTTGFAPSGATKYSEVLGTAEAIRTLPDGTALVAGTTYFVKLIAKDVDGAAAAGTQGSATPVLLASSSLIPDGVAPASSPTPTVTSGPLLLAVSWTPITNNDFVTYKVFVRAGTAPTTSTGLYQVGRTAGASFVITQLADGSALVVGTTYHVKLVATDADGSASASADATGTVAAVPSSGETSDGAAPGSSPTPTVISGPLLLAVSWAPVTNNDLVSYKVFVRAGAAPTTSDATYQVGITPGASFVITKLADGSALVVGTTYHVKIVSTDVDGSAAASSDATGTVNAVPSSGATSDGAAPGSSPSLATGVTGGPKLFSLNWTPVANTDTVTYDVYVSATTGFTPGVTADALTPVLRTSASSAVIQTLASGAAFAYGTTYYFKLIARDGDGSAAAGTQGSAQMVQVGTVDVANLAITAAQVAAAAITTAKIAADAVTASEIAAGAVGSSELAALAVTSAAVAANAITAGKIAADAVTAAEIATGAVGPTELAALAVTSAAVAANAITAGKIAADAVTAAEIATGAVGPTEIAALAVTSAAVAASAITTAKIAADAVTASEIAASAVGSSELAAGAVIAGKITAGTIVAADIAANVITAAQIAAGTITATQIATDTITASQIAASAITSSELAAGAVIAGKITAGTIVAADMAANTITAGKIAAGTITATEIATDTITASQIAASAITSSELAAGAVIAGKITAGTIVAADIAANTITAAKIAAGTITTTEILADTITAANIAASAITSSELAAGAVIAGKITAGTIVAADIAANTITAAKIAAGTITATEILADTITASQIAASAITSSELAAGAVIAGKITAGTIVAADIAAATITGAKIAATTIAAGNIVADTITASQIAASAITSSELAAGAVIAGKITAGTIVAADIAANVITAAQIAAGTITATQIATDTITASQIAASAITSSELAAGAVIAGKITAGTIVAADIAANTITAAKIAAGTITTAEIAANTITAADILANTITANELAAGSVTAAAILAGTITANELASVLIITNTLKTATSGRRVEITPAGVQLIEADESVLVNLPTDTATPAAFNGQLVAAALTATGPAELRSTLNVLTSTAALTLLAGQAAPTAGPALAQGVELGAVTWSTGLYGTLVNIWHDGTNLYANYRDPTATPWTNTIEKRSTDGVTIVATASLASTGSSDGIYSLVKIGSYWYGLLLRGAAWRWQVWDATGTSGLPGARTAEAVLAEWGGGAWPIITSDGTGIRLAMTNMPTNQKLWLGLYGAPGTGAVPTFTSNVLSSDIPFAGATALTGVVYSAADLGATRWIVRGSNATTVATYNTTGTRQATESWETAEGATFGRGLTWNGANFVEAGIAGALYKYSTWITAGATSLKYWGAFTWYDSAGTTHETTLSPRTAITLLNRRRLSVTWPTIPGAGGADDPNSVRLYLKANATDPGAAFASYFLQGATFAGTQTYLNTYSTSTAGVGGTAFPGGTGAQITNTVPTTMAPLNGNGDGFIPIGAVQMFAAAVAPVGWLLCDGASYLRATYPNLFALLGITYGSVDGTHFNVPDMRSRFPIGAGTFGALTSSDSLAEAARTTHHSHGAGSLVDSVNTLAAGLVGTGAATVAKDGHKHTISGSVGASVNNDIPFMALNFIIKT